MSSISSHILDTSCGRPAAGVMIVLEHKNAETWQKLGDDTTNSDGRVKNLTTQSLTKGVYRLTFHTAEYFSRENRETFYPHITIVFEIKADDEHYHVPLLLNGFGYSTYRGS